MARYTGPKNKLARAHGRDLSLKTNSAKLDRRLQVPPGVHGPKGHRRKKSDYGIQLEEKQKAKRIYGILERQFNNYFKEARKDQKATGTKLLQLLEMRLDNVVYRLNFAPTRTAARQFVNHGHVLVNGKKISIPSYRVNKGDQISLNAKIQKNPDVKTLLEDKKLTVPAWLTKKAIVGKVIREPERQEVESEIEDQLIVEYYSR